MKSDMREKVAKSLTAESTALLPYLPYLLQDLWELGSSPDEIVSAITLLISPVSNRHNEPTPSSSAFCGRNQ
ncbi:MAG: hypothetical protein ACM3S4_04950 [Burkholderiales bacterium]